MFGQQQKTHTGFTLIEALIGTAIFITLAMSVYQAYLVTMNTVRLSRTKITASALANEQFEIIRNLPYNEVGIINGLPLGKIPANQTLVRDNKEFTIKTTIRNIDDPFDGTIGGEPNDTSPADYKLAELEISCALCKNFTPLIINTYIAPKNLESASNNGALFVKVYDANGLPVSGASVHIENNQFIPNFIINDTTNNDGILQIVDAPPGIQAYAITVTKDGYTREQTYTTDNPDNPNPIIPHATVLIQQLTQVSFSIDEVSTLNVSSTDNLCTQIPNIDFSLQGSKLIGMDPDIYKYNEIFGTNNDGLETINNLEWDTYNLTFLDDLYDLVGVIPSSSFLINPGTEQDLKLIVAPKNPKSLLITVKDAITNLPLSNATVNLTGIEYDNTLTTGHGFIRQTDWSGGAGQDNYIDKTKYLDSDGNIEINNPEGIISLKNTLNEYHPNGWLISSTFDTGSISNFHQIFWQPQNQPIETGSDNVRVQIATNNNKTTWNFVGPDGTTNTYYTNINQKINEIHNNDRYLRYKVYLHTDNILFTPTISDMSFTFTSDCVPPGQVFFTGLINDSYNFEIIKLDYEPYTSTISTLKSWQQLEITLNP